MRDTRRGAVEATAAMGVVGSLTAVSATLHGYPLFGGQALRYAVAGLLLALLVRRDGTRRRPTGREQLLLAALGATGLAWFNVCVVTATRYATPAMLSTVVATVPIVFAVAGPLQQRRRPAPQVIVGALVVTAGALVATGLGHGGLAGILWSVGALAGEACFSLLAVPLLPRLGPVRVSAYACGWAVPLLVLAGLVADGPAGLLAVPTVGQSLALAYLIGPVTVITFLVWYDALGRLGADRAGLFAGLMPIASVLATMLLDHRPPGLPDLAGTLLVGAGLAAGLRRPAEPGTSRRTASRNLVGAHPGGAERSTML